MQQRSRRWWCNRSSTERRCHHAARRSLTPQCSTASTKNAKGRGNILCLSASCYLKQCAISRRPTAILMFHAPGSPNWSWLGRFWHRSVAALWWLCWVLRRRRRWLPWRPAKSPHLSQLLSCPCVSSCPFFKLGRSINASTSFVNQAAPPAAFTPCLLWPMAASETAMAKLRIRARCRLQSAQAHRVQERVRVRP